VTEAITRHKNVSQLKSLVPGSWINANFNVWIGAPEDNKAWDYLYHARNFYAQAAPGATEKQRDLAFEEVMIARAATGTGGTGRSTTRRTIASSTNSIANTCRMFTRHWAGPSGLSGAADHRGAARPLFTPQTAYIHPGVTGDMVRYFEWMGAARYTADQRSGAMHGKQFSDG